MNAQSRPFDCVAVHLVGEVAQLKNRRLRVRRHGRAENSKERDGSAGRLHLVAANGGRS
jgi:hypothetical protein